MKIPLDAVLRVHALYRTGRFVDAFEAAEKVAPLRKWEGADARVMAGRLAGNVGASMLGSALFTTAWKSDPANPRATYFMSYVVRDRRGLLEAWEWTSARAELPGAPATILADWHALRAGLAGRLRDFDTADRLIRKAMEVDASKPWVHVEHSDILQQQDQYEAALAAIDRALEIRPGYVPAVRTKADLFQLLGRDRDALDLLTPAARGGQSYALLAQLASLEFELGLLADARADLERALAVGRLLEAAPKSWVRARLCDVAHVLGDDSAAAAYARESGSAGYAEYADRVAQADRSRRRVILPVPFVRQHHVTCAPATLTAISRFWGRAADHLGVAEKICYDGTPAHSERNWAAEEGWAVREFTVTWDVAANLLDRGIPFTLSLRSPKMGHLQAVAGYDPARKTLLIRDPSERQLLEYDAEPFLQATRSTGPRGMAMAPANRKAELDALPLPDAAVYDRLHELISALDRRDRDAAQRAMDALDALDPAHTLTLRARVALAAYDGDTVRRLEAVDALLTKFPDDDALLLDRLAALQVMARQEERIEILERRCRVPKSYPGFRKSLADELASDARRVPQAERLLREYLHRMPYDGEAYESLSGICWNRGERDRAVELMRFASGLRERDSDLALRYFTLCRAHGCADAGLETLKSRVARFGRKSSNPARALHEAYSLLEQGGSAKEVLEEALAAHPGDGELKLFAAAAAAFRGDIAAAEKHLEEARSKSRPFDVLKTRLRVALVAGTMATALDCCRKILEADPFDIDARTEFVRLLGESGQRGAAGEHLRAAADQFPHMFGLQQLHIQWLQEAEPAGAGVEKALRSMVALSPRNAWTRRELATVLARQGRYPEALAECDEAAALEPHAVQTSATRAFVLRLAGRGAEQAQAAKEAVRTYVGSLSAVSDLIDAEGDAARRRESLKFVAAEIRRQAIVGEALLVWREKARENLRPDEIVADLREIWTARPDLWSAWEALVLELASGPATAEAVDLGRRAADLFPLVPRIRLALAQACRTANLPDEEKAALMKALEISPGDPRAAGELAAFHRRRGRFDEELSVLSGAVGRSPLDGGLLESLARCLASLGRKEEAVERLVHAVRAMPRLETAWSLILEWTADLGRPGDPHRIAREVAAGQPTNAATWVALARLPAPPAELQERIEALDKAIALEPRLSDALDLKAILLVQAGRFDEAAACCVPPPGAGRDSLYLRGRGVWVEWRRGKADKAIKAMANLLEEDPGYTWGWSQLYEWCAKRDPERALRAAEALVRLNPGSSFALLSLAEAKEAVRNKEGAKLAYRAAFAADPDLHAAAARLIDLHLADREFDAAEAAIASLRGQDCEGMRLERRIKLEIERGNRKRAAEILSDLTRLPDEGSLAGAVENFLEAGESVLAAAGLERAIFAGTAIPAAGLFWIKCVLRQQRWWDARKGLKRFRAWSKVWERAACQYLETAAEAGRRWDVRWFVFWNKARIREGATSWGSTGYAFVRQEAHRRVCRWMSDWRDRKGVEAWMLLNLAVSMRVLGRHRESGEVSVAALRLRVDGSTDMHKMWLALDAADEGPVAAAATALEAFEVSSLMPFLKQLRGFGLAVVAARRGGFKEARRILAEAVRETQGPRLGRDARSAWVRCVRRIARERGGLVGPLWWVWTRLSRL